ncbi:cutinase family protein [Nocardia sp. NPDC058633]|uniref:cutinase family protein n=1 Tax=Nocardia sp. NPDC058633 TaxID=3346568 RepID=UPI0036536CC3
MVYRRMTIFADRDRPSSAHRSVLRPATEALALVMVVLCAAMCAQAGRASAQEPTRCAPFTALMAPGTWETTATADPDTAIGMLAPIGNGLEAELGDDIDVRYVPYAASAFDQGLTYSQSKDTLLTALREMLSGLCASTKVMIAGYSQGADGAGDIAADIGNGRGPIAAQRVIGVGLLADPKRDPSTTTALGPHAPGRGLAGIRPGGFGQLSSVVRTICLDGDLYCSIREGAQPFLAAIGQIFSGNADLPAYAGELSRSLVSGLSSGALAGVNPTISALTDSAESLSGESASSAVSATAEAAEIGDEANSLVSVLHPLRELLAFVQKFPAARDKLRAAAAGSPESAALAILDVLEQMDIEAALAAATELIATAKRFVDGGLEGAVDTVVAELRDALAPLAHQLAAKIAPLLGLDEATLSAGTQILKLLQPNVIIDQITNIGTGVMQLAAAMPRIMDCFTQLPDAITAGDIRSAHRLSGELNNLFAPAIRMAARADFALVSDILGAAAILDPSGLTMAVALVAELLSRLDMIRIANDIGLIQEVGWRALELLNDGDHAGANAELAGLAPIGLDLAGAAAGLFTDVPKTDPSLLGVPNQVDTRRAALVDALESGDVRAVVEAVVALVDSTQLDELVDLVGQGVDVATFYASGVHMHYGPGAEHLRDFLSERTSQ